jgi:hypothetical protein
VTHHTKSSKVCCKSQQRRGRTCGRGPYPNWWRETSGPQQRRHTTEFSHWRAITGAQSFDFAQLIHARTPGTAQRHPGQLRWIPTPELDGGGGSHSTSPISLCVSCSDLHSMPGEAPNDSMQPRFGGWREGGRGASAFIHHGEVRAEGTERRTSRRGSADHASMAGSVEMRTEQGTGDDRAAPLDRDGLRKENAQSD